MSARHFVKQLAATADRVKPPPPGVTILIYHRVGGGSGGEVDLDPAAFERQLDHLAEHHRVISLDQAATELLDSEEQRPAVVITFDDGTADFTEHAVPALVERSLPATLYVATDFVERGERFPWDAPPTSWSALREAMASDVVTIGSHTHTHALLDRADPAAVAGELDRSIELIGDRLGVPPRHFAYPKALPGSDAAEREVRTRFATAAIARSRVNRPGRSDLHRLSRTPIQRSDGYEHFERKAAGGLRLEGELRDGIARIRYRGATR